MIGWIWEHPGAFALCYLFGAIFCAFLASAFYGWWHRRAARKDGWHQTRSRSDAFVYGERWEKIPPPSVKTKAEAAE